MFKGPQSYFEQARKHRFPSPPVPRNHGDEANFGRTGASIFFKFHS